MTNLDPNQNIFDITIAKVKNSASTIRRTVVWSFPIKLALSGLIGALGGSSLLGIFSEYANYFYAMSYGIRPPIEGIPYLKASVTLISLALLTSGAILFAFTILLFKWFAISTNSLSRGIRISLTKGKGSFFRRLSTSIKRNDVTRVFKEKPWWFRCLGSFVTGAIIYGVFEAFQLFFPPRPSIADTINIITAAYTVFACIAFITITQPSSIKWVATLTTLAYFSAWLIFLFTPNYYSHFLRLVGYGGGLPVSIELREKSTSDLSMDKNLHLIIRTTEAFILLNDSTNQFIEIPKDQIRSIRHSTGGLDNLTPYLPTTKQQALQAQSPKVPATENSQPPLPTTR